MTDGLTKHQRYGRSSKGKARDQRHATTESHLDSQRRYHATTKGMLTDVRRELAHARREALASQD